MRKFRIGDGVVLRGSGDSAHAMTVTGQGMIEARVFCCWHTDTGEMEREEFPPAALTLCFANDDGPEYDE
jgi:uncharacterized protein YodC (DUF2158 family)